MGCCASRSGDVIKINRDNLSSFIESQKFNTLTCHSIGKLEDKVLNKTDFESYAKSSQIPIPFDLVQINSKVQPLELKLALLLFSKDSVDKKVKLFNRLLKNQRQKLRFFEWKYQLMNERLPRLMLKMKNIEKEEEQTWVEYYRVRAGQEITFDWESLKQESFVPTLEILSVN